MRRFDPRDLGNLAAWYDVADFSTVTIAGGILTQLSDKSGNGNHQIGEASTGGVYNASVINSLPGVVLADGKFMTAADDASLDYTTFTAFVVFLRDTDSGGNQGIFGKQTAGGTNREFMFFITSTDTQAIQTTTDGTSGTNTTPAFGTNTVATPYILTGYSDGTITAGRSNVTPRNQGAAASVFAGTGTLDLGRAFGAFSQSTIGEAMLFGTKLSEVDIRKVEAYLSSKWGIT